MLKIENLTKIYPASGKSSEKMALDNVSLNVPKRSFFALLGPNGAGKSTLINIVAGLLVKTQGKIIINDIDYDEHPTEARYHIGIVPQELVIDTFFTVKEGLELAAGYYGVRPENRRSDEIIEALGLKDKSNTLTRHLSGGMKRRFLVAKAMVHSPKILILDEPTAGVDLMLREQLWEYVTHLNKEGTTIILTTHYLEEAEKLCDHIAFIKQGSIVTYNTKEKLLSNFACKEMIIEFVQDVENISLKEYSLKKIAPFKFRLQINDTNLNTLMQDLLSLNLEIKDIQSTHIDLEHIFKKIMQ